MNLNLESMERRYGILTHQHRMELDRFLAEAEFAGKLCDLHPGHAVSWRRLLEKAAQPVIETLAHGGTRLKEAVRDAEKILLPIQKTAKNYTVHCTGHAHIDMNWMWSWPETVAVTNDTFATVLRLMDEYPDFCFSQSQASVYAIIERHHPEMLKQIARRVKEGRWEVTASHWVEGDKNIIGGESLCRHLLYTRGYMQNLFGLKPEDVPIDWAPDTFGHAATMPTYLVRGGVKYLYMHRPGVFATQKPWAFWWEGPDGSRVLVRNDIKVGYNGQITPRIARFLVDYVQETGCNDFMFVYGVGDHGGGPTRCDILMLKEMATWPIFPHFRFSTVREYFELLEKQGRRLPVLRGEFNTENTGCYTSQSLIKKANRFGENRLVDAEVAASILWAVDNKPYPRALLEEGWRDVLFSHFHDILPGSGMHDTRTFTHGLFQKTMAMTSMVEINALRQLAARVDTSRVAQSNLEMPPAILANGIGAGVGNKTQDGTLSRAEQSNGSGSRPFVMFNPTSWNRNDIVEATVWDDASWGMIKPLKERNFVVETPDGKMISVQKVQDGGFWGHQYVTLAFPVEVAGMGYGLHTVVETASSSGGPGFPSYNSGWAKKSAVTRGAFQTSSPHHCTYMIDERPSEGLENEFLRLDLNPCTGGIRLLLDKRTKTKLVAQEKANPLLIFETEKPHGMTAWCIDNVNAQEWPLMTAIRRKLDGPYKAAIEVDYKIRESQFTLTYELRAGDPQLYLHLKGTWFQRGTLETGVPSLSLAVPFTLNNAKARYEIPFGAIDRPFNRLEEMPALQWAQITGQTGGKTAGCLLINDSKYGYALDGSTLRLSLIRGSCDPDPLPEIGEHEVHLALFPFQGKLSVSEATRCGRNLNHALRVVGTSVHRGDLPAIAQFLTVQPSNVILSEVKVAEDGRALILRCFEADGKPAMVRVNLDTQKLGKLKSVTETDLLERPMKKSSARGAKNQATVRIPSHGIATIKIELD